MARARSNVVKTLATVAFFFIFCWTWNQTYYLMFYLDYPLIDFTSAFYNFTVIMVFLNCCVNPVIYSIKYEQVTSPASFTYLFYIFTSSGCLWHESSSIPVYFTIIYFQSYTSITYIVCYIYSVSKK